MRWPHPVLHPGRRRAWWLLGGAIVALLLFAEVVDDVFRDPLEGDFEAEAFDTAIRHFVSGLRTPALTQVMMDLTAFGSVSVIAVLFVVFVGVLLSYRDYRGIAFVTTLLAGAAVWPSLLKAIFGRGRPDAADWLVRVGELSFPSGHAFGAAAAYIGFAYYAGRHARTMTQEICFYTLGALLAVVVGATRIYLGVHYPTDVLAGWSAGVAWGLLLAGVYELTAERPGR